MSDTDRARLIEQGRPDLIIGEVIDGHATTPAINHDLYWAAIKSFITDVKARLEVQADLEKAQATIAAVQAILDGPDPVLIASRVRAALEAHHEQA